MGHNHTHNHSHHSSKNIQIAFFLNFGFAILEVVGGLLTNSVAIIADAIHDLGDSTSLGLAWFLQNYSTKDSNQKYTYGYGRFSLLGALINALILIGGSVLVLSEAIPRLIEPEPTNAPGMIVLAIVGMVVNGIAVLRLKGDRTMNARVVTWHLLEDVLGWVAVCIAGIILLFFNIPAIDPILAILLSLYVLYNVIKNIGITLSLFLQSVPENIDISQIEQQFLQLEGVKSIDRTHLWSLDGDRHVLTTHLMVDENASKEEILWIKSASKTIVHDWNIEYLTIEIEYENEKCSIQ